MTVLLHAYRYSVYARIVRMVLAEKSVAFETEEVNPFDPARPAAHLALHPFGRVPVLDHDGFVLYETGAITRYVDRAFAGPSLQPLAPRAAARMDQIVGICDSYVYWPLVRQVFSHAVFRPRLGQPGDPAEIEAGLGAADGVLDALEALAPQAGWLTGDDLSLADLHLGAMIAYFALEPRAQAQLAGRPRLLAWWTQMARRPSLRSTDPGLPVTKA